MKPLLREQVVEKLEKMDLLDPLSESVQKVVRSVVADESQTKDALSGTWLGHPLHPLLTDVVIGCWSSAFLLDWLGGKESRQGAQRLVGLGILAAVPTAAAGLSDWSDLWGGQRRVGTIHALGNVAGLLTMMMSWLSRRRGHHFRGKALGVMGAAGMVGSAYLGGHLSFGKGVGVSQTSFEEWPEGWTAVLDETDLRDGELTAGKAGDVGILLYKRGERIYALADRCTHRGCALHEGRVEGDDVVCACHGSTFDLEDGTIQKGPATAPQLAFEARVNAGKVEVRPKPLR